MNEIIKLNKIEKQYGERKILKNLSIEFKEKTFYAIMGSSGSGKTTALKIASGLETPDSGEAIVMKQNISEMKEPKLTKFRVKNIGFIFQDYSLVEYLSVKENILFSVNINKEKIDPEKFNKILETVGLKGQENKMPSQLSGGQKQRVAVARSLISSSQVIFADEPTGALDISTRKNILKLLRDAVDQFGKTVIMVTHDPEAASFADETYFLAAGHLDTKLKGASAKDIATKLISLEAKHV